MNTFEKLDAEMGLNKAPTPAPMTEDELKRKNRDAWLEKLAAEELSRPDPSDQEPDCGQFDNVSSIHGGPIVVTGKPGTEGDESPLTMSVADLADKPIAERRWLVEGAIPGREVTLLYGDGGLGKSLLAMQLASSVASGKRWVGLGTEKGKAVYLGAEDDLDEMHRRLSKICASYGIGLADLGNMHIRSLAGEDALLAASTTQHQPLTPSALYERVIATISELRPAVVVLDTLADLYPSDEIYRTHVRQFIGMLKRPALEYDCAVVVLAHPSKSGMTTGRGDSGSTAWNNSVRSRLYLTKPEGEDANPNERVLEVKKLNYGKSGDQYRLHWEEGAFKQQKGVNILDKAAAEGKAKTVFMKLLRELNQQGRYVNSTSGAQFAPLAFSKHPENEGITKAKFRSAMETLFSEGRITAGEVGKGSKARTVIMEA